MKCRKCKAEIPDESKYCLKCGAKQSVQQRTKSRGNGQGSVYKLPNGTWIAIKTLGYRIEPDGKSHRITRSKSGFKTKKDAVEYLPQLSTAKKEISITFQKLYDTWMPTHKASKSTMDCYSAAMKHFQPVWFLKVAE